MAKDPAFLFYSKDWLEGTAEMLPQEKGIYIDLLCHQHQKGDIPADTQRLARLVGLSETEFLPIWEGVKSKFVEANGIPNGTPNGKRLVNRKLTEVMGERATKGHKNKIIGTLASLIRHRQEPEKIKNLIKKAFKVDDFTDVPTELLTERLTEWYIKRLKSIENGNAIANEDGNIIKEGGAGEGIPAGSSETGVQPPTAAKVINIDFDTFWDLYDKKVGPKDKLQKKWAALTDKERQAAMEHIPKYKESQPDKQYRKDPCTYLNNKAFNDEIIPSNGTPRSITKPVPTAKPEGSFTDGW